MRADTPEWEPGRRDTLETLPSDFVPPFPASGGGISALRRGRCQAVKQGLGRCRLLPFGERTTKMIVQV